MALVTLAHGEHCERLAQLVNPAKQAYCRRHGYDFVHFDELLDPARPPAWSKILAVLDVLPRYDWVCWHDADTLIWNRDAGLQQFVSELDDELLLFQDDPVGLNSGVFFARNSAATFEFFARVYDQTQYTDHFLWEQIAIQHLLETSCRSLPHRRMAVALPPQLQCIYNFHSPPWTAPFLHMAGLRSPERVELVERFVRLAETERIPAPSRWDSF
jgi:mannan polymerase II complex MNN10 subunit